MKTTKKGDYMLTSSKLNLKHALLLGSSVAAFAWAAAPAMAQNTKHETVIVTGTRVQGMTAADSAAPVTVLGSDALSHGTGSADLRQALGQTVPSFTAQSFGGDTANLTLSAALRGLSPNDTLVLINGKRRHYTANLHVAVRELRSGRCRRRHFADPVGRDRPRRSAAGRRRRPVRHRRHRRRGQHHPEEEILRRPVVG